MKKVIAIFLAAILIFSLAACGGTSGDTNSKTETSTSETKTGDTSSANNTSTDGKTLIVYFSWSNNTEKMANYIHEYRKDGELYSRQNRRRYRTH